MEVDKASGMLKLELNGHTHELRVDFRAILNIQEDLGYGLVPLAVKFLNRDYGLKEQAIVFYHCLISASPSVPPTKDKVAEQIFKHGLSDPNLTSAISAICEFALSGGNKDDDSQSKKKQESHANQ